MTIDDSPERGTGPFERLVRIGRHAAGAGLRRLRARLRGFLSWQGITALTLGLLVLLFSGLIALPFPPFGTTGRIYVDSPEVYTRERLVNDRYDQDYWLREQLKKLEEPERLSLPVRSEVTGTTLAAPSAGPGATSPGGPGGTSAADEAGATRRLSFEQSLQVAGGIRDMIRQQLLENMLDDRHDLTGNSLYGLKFDTTVIPGRNTLRPAFVRVTLTVDDQFPQPYDSTSRLVAGWKANALAPYLDESGRRDLAPMIAQFAKQRDFYVEWLNDIERRLGRTEDSVYESMREGAVGLSEAAFRNRLMGKTLGIVLGIPEETFMRLNAREGPTPTDAAPAVAADGGHYLFVRLPDPWAKFMIISAKPMALADESPSSVRRVSFKVTELLEKLTVMATRNTALRAPQSPQSPQAADGANGHPTTISITADSKWQIMVPDWLMAMRYQWFEDSGDIGPKYLISSSLIETMIDVQSAICAHQEQDGRPCAAPSKESGEVQILVPSGLFNFIERMAKRDAYAYAIFPKNDVVGVFAETRAQVSANAGLTGLLGLTRTLAETRTAPVLVGFSDGQLADQAARARPDDGDDSVNFGWVISSQGAMQPVLKSQLALISVPAWTDRLHIRVAVGWIDRSGNPELDPDGGFELSVAVPPSYEVFDSILRGAEVKLGPSIRDNEMDRAIYVRTGQATRILIPGSRLWRSAAVTLGAQSAGRIRVLPNMEGIIAEFDPVDPPYAAPDTETEPPRPDAGATGPRTDYPIPGLVADESEQCRPRIKGPGGRELLVKPARLRVWTSEGVAKAKRPVCVVYDPEDVLGSGRGARPEAGSR